jgi:hypothetical protein
MERNKFMTVGLNFRREGRVGGLGLDLNVKSISKWEVSRMSGLNNLNKIFLYEVIYRNLEQIQVYLDSRVQKMLDWKSIMKTKA